VRSVVKVVGFVPTALLLVAVGGYAWAFLAASAKLSRTYTVHTVDFAVPFPLPEKEVRRIGGPVDVSAVVARDGEPEIAVTSWC
jgi:hypothetical protein